MSKQTTEYKNGFDAGLNGSDKTNTHFSNFGTAESTADWEQGNRDGKKEKAKGKIKKSNPRKKHGKD